MSGNSDEDGSVEEDEEQNWEPPSWPSEQKATAHGSVCPKVIQAMSKMTAPASIKRCAIGLGR